MVTAAFEGSRVVSRDSATREDVINRCSAILQVRNVTNFTITLTPNRPLDEIANGDTVSIRIDAPTAGNVVGPSFLHNQRPNDRREFFSSLGTIMWTRLFSLRSGKKMLTEQGGKRRRGAILILLLLLLPGLLLLIGGAIDLSYLQLSRAEMRLAVDAATRAAADELARSESTEAATRKAPEIARLNEVAGQPLLLRPTDLQFGAASPNSNGRWVFSAGGTPFNSVRITGVSRR